MTKWAYSNDGENYHGEHDSPYDAIAEGIDEAVDSLAEDETEAGLSIGEVGRPEPLSLLVHDLATDRLLEEMLDRAGELAWPDEATRHLESIPSEVFLALKRKLQATVDQWAAEYGMGTGMNTIGRVYEFGFEVGRDSGETLQNAFDAWESLACKGGEGESDG